MRIEPFNFNNLRDFSGAEAEKVALDALQAAEALEQAMPEEEAPPPPPTFSEAEMQQAQQASRDRGFEEGVKEGREQVEGEETERSAHIQNMLQQTVQECAGIKANYHHMLQQQCAIMTEFVRVAAEKMAGDLLKAVPHEAIEAVVMNALPLLVAQPKLTFFVQKEMVDPVHKKILPHLKARGLEADINVAADETMQPSDIRIEWRQGHVQRATAEIMQQVHGMLSHIDFGTNLKALSEEEEAKAIEDVPVTPLELHPEEEEAQATAPEHEDVEHAHALPAEEETPDTAAPDESDAPENAHVVDMGVVTHVATDEAEDGIEIMHASEGETYLSVGDIDDIVDAHNQHPLEEEPAVEDNLQEASAAETPTNIEEKTEE